MPLNMTLASAVRAAMATTAMQTGRASLFENAQVKEWQSIILPIALPLHRTSIHTSSLRSTAAR